MDWLKWLRRKPVEPKRAATVPADTRTTDYLRAAYKTSPTRRPGGHRLHYPPKKVPEIDDDAVVPAMIPLLTPANDCRPTDAAHQHVSPSACHPPSHTPSHHTHSHHGTSDYGSSHSSGHSSHSGGDYGGSSSSDSGGSSDGGGGGGGGE
jgi:uncharacterized membrane protein YgcG